MTGSRLLVRPSNKPLHGSVPLPSDRSITHRALILAGLSNGPCEIRGFGYGGDNLGTLLALGALGVTALVTTLALPAYTAKAEWRAAGAAIAPRGLEGVCYPPWLARCGER